MGRDKLGKTPKCPKLGSPHRLELGTGERTVQIILPFKYPNGGRLSNVTELLWI